MFIPITTVGMIATTLIAVMIVIMIAIMRDDTIAIILVDTIPTMLGVTIPITAIAAPATGIGGPAIVILNVRTVGITIWTDESCLNKSRSNPGEAAMRRESPPFGMRLIRNKQRTGKGRELGIFFHLRQVEFSIPVGQRWSLALVNSLTRGKFGTVESRFSSAAP